ncbi:MAG: ABC transporter substrate-binding protein, partial [Calditrichaeota bacterium]|nr:ABC transporter substrate-binding protein [Calditrichota bacterium]
TYFNKINAEGGVNGRQIKLVSLDDGYEPGKAEDNTRALINDRQVFALIGEVGTPTSQAAVPLAAVDHVPFFTPFTGAGFLREGDKNFVINFRGSYAQEMERLAEYLVDKKGFNKIACFYQDDGYGKAGLSGIERALSARSKTLVAKGTYQRNTVDIAGGLNAISGSAPDAVILVGTYKPCATFIKAALQTPGLKTATFCNISFVGTKALQEELGEQQEGVIVSQVVPFPWDARLPIVKEFLTEMKKVGKLDDAEFITLEGYMSAKLFCLALQNVVGEPTRDALLKSVYATREFNLGGITLNFGPGDNQGMDKVFLVEYRAGKIQSIN